MIARWSKRISDIGGCLIELDINGMLYNILYNISHVWPQHDEPGKEHIHSGRPRISIGEMRLEGSVTSIIERTKLTAI